MAKFGVAKKVLVNAYLRFIENIVTIHAQRSNSYKTLKMGGNLNSALLKCAQ